MEIDEYLSIVKSQHRTALPWAFDALAKNFELEREVDFYNFAYAELPRLVRIIEELLDAIDEVEHKSLDEALLWVFKYTNEV